ncbi:O-antigen polymerase [Sulfitobacter sp. 1A13191]|uniref:O-antigen polymerase n=1 Tax=Sulfitobacter sp. 1A13191 TaxID=3368589 RepID=UPI003746626F
MLIALSLGLICSIALITRAKNLLFFSNLSVFLGIWSILMTLYSLNLSVFPKLSGSLTLYILTFHFLYIFIYFLTASGFPTSRGANTAPAYYDQTNPQLKRHLSFASQLSFALWAFFFVKFLASLQSVGGAAVFLTGGGARKMLSETEGVSLTFYVFAYLFLVTAMLLVPHLTRYRKVAVYAGILFVLGSLLLTAAKVNVVSGAFLIYAIWFNRKKIGFANFCRQFGALVILGYAFIFLFSAFTGKVVDKSVGSIDNISDVLRYGKSAFLYPYDYLVGSLAALDYRFASIHSSDYSNLVGGHSFYSVYRIASAFGLISDTADLPDQFYGFVWFGGVNTNIYTFLYDLMLDFGEIGALLFAPLLAMLHASLDMRETIGRNIALIMLSNISKLSAFLSFVNFRYGDTVFVFSLFVWLLYLGGAVLSKRAERGGYR